jgi:hypothetical protein
MRSKELERRERKKMTEKNRTVLSLEIVVESEEWLEAHIVMNRGIKALEREFGELGVKRIYANNIEGER